MVSMDVLFDGQDSGGGPDLRFLEVRKDSSNYELIVNLNIHHGAIYQTPQNWCKLNMGNYYLAMIIIIQLTKSISF